MENCYRIKAKTKPDSTKTLVVLENNNMAQLAASRYRTVHSQPQEDLYDTDAASPGQVYEIFVPQSNLSAVQSGKRPFSLDSL